MSQVHTLCNYHSEQNNIKLIALCSHRDIKLDKPNDADDVWFKAMALLNDVKYKKVSDERDFFRRFLLISASQDIALQENNIVENDRQIEKIFNEYNLSNRISS